LPSRDPSRKVYSRTSLQAITMADDMTLTDNHAPSSATPAAARPDQTVGGVTSRSHKRSSSFVAAALLGVVLLGANHELTMGQAVPKWDADMFFAPFQMLVADHARAGKFLLWDPWVSGGSPDYAEPQIGAFSPLAIGVGLVTGGTELSFRVYWLIIWFLGGLGVFCLGRHLKAPVWGCYVVALAYMFSGFYTGHAEHTSTLYTISSLGFVIWRLDVALSRRALRPAAEAGVIWGLSALGGYPGWVFLNACFAALWAAGRAWFSATADDGDNLAGVARTESNGPRSAIGFAALAVATLVCIGLPVLLPTYAAFLVEAPGYTDRSQPLTRELAVTFNALHPGTLATFASPYLSTLQRVNPGLWEYTDLTTTSVYLGPVVPVLAMLALVCRPGDRWRWWISALIVVFLFAAFGQSVPLRGWLYDLIPPMRYFRHAGFFRIYPMFAIVVLASLATRDLALGGRDAGSRLFTRFVITAGCVAALAMSAYYAVTLAVEHAGQHATIAEAHVWLVWSGICVIALALTRAPAHTRTWLTPALLITLATADVFVTVPLARLTMYENDGRARAIWDRVAREHNPSFDLAGLRREQLAPEWLTAEGMPHDKNLPLKVPTFQNYVAVTNRFYADLVQRPVLSRMATGANRIWFARDVVAVPPTDAAYTAFVARSETLQGGVLVVHPRELMTSGTLPAEDAAVASISRLPAAAPIGVRLDAYRPDELRFEVTSPEKGWLLVTDRWSRGWRATVNGRHADVWGGNFIFRALEVEAGRNDVHFTYDAVGFPFLLILSWSTVFVTLAYALYDHRHRRGRRST
jgi:hypothetical protein